MDLVHGTAGFLVVAVTESAADAAAGGLGAVFGGFLIGAVNVAEQFATLFCFRIVVTGLVVEHSVFLVPEKPEIESCHNMQR